MENELFENTPVNKAYLKLALPLVMSMIVTMIYNLADTYFIAATGDTNLVAGVSLCAPIFTMLMAFGNIFGQGGTSLISRMLGQKDHAGVRHVSAFCFYAAIICGALVGVIMLVFSGPLLNILGANSDTFQHAFNYYIVLAIGAPFTVASFIPSNLLRAEGLSKESMIGTISGAVLNIILDPILISVCGMGSMGAAVATIAGYILSDIYFIFIILRKSRQLSLVPAEMKIQPAQAGQIFGIGIPAAITNICSSICLILTNQFLLPYGNDKIAAMGIVLKVTMVAQLIMTGLAFGGQPLIGYLYGAKNHTKMRQLLRFSFSFISITAMVIAVIIFAAAPLILKGFMDSEEIISIGTVMLRWQVASNLMAALVQLFTIYFQSAGRMVGSFLLSISRQGVVFIIVLVVFANIAGLNGIIASQFAADLISAVLGGLLFYRQLYGELLGK